MAGDGSRNASPLGAPDDSTIISTRGLEAFGRKVTSTAGQLMGPLDPTASTHYQNAMSDLHKQLRRPNLQRSVFSFARTSPTDLVRSRLSTSEIQYRALTFLPDELLRNIPEDDNTYSLFQGFQATMPTAVSSDGKKHRRKVSRGRRLLEDEKSEPDNTPPSLAKLKKEQDALNHRLEMMSVRKHMSSSEIHEIDNKIANLNSMRKIVLNRLADLEQEEAILEHDILDLENRLEDAQDELENEESMKAELDLEEADSASGDSTFMSESIYEKLPSSSPTKNKKNKVIRRKSMPILHEHFEPGSNIREIKAHGDMITALDFDVPFGTMVTSALDDTVRVWDLNAGICMGLLEGHTASVRALQVEDNFVATGSMDATIRLWDLSKARYEPPDNRINKDSDDEEEDHLAFGGEEEQSFEPPVGTMRDCPVFTLEAHVDEVTALHFKGDTLISGSSDKTLRQWDLQKGRCVQTLDVMWAAAQASASMGSSEGAWRSTGKVADANADFVGAVQVFDAALACGTADGMVRLWDLRSGQVHRSLVGHTGPVTCLQFDDMHLVTGSLDRSIRIWDLRTGAIHDAYAYDQPITSMMFDNRRIVSACGEDVAKVYDKTDGRHWDCGPGANAEGGKTLSTVETVRIKDGYLTEGRSDGVVGIWTC
ncbi:hypothetical protein HYALB_00001578 [Hymenoscyphus albidus]|uniref:Mitochondrial division protein 1 n=1 Tax=Hymenoscyphus albidus TaxID=595503 RepID=A0A9N9LFS4_9HELO|nr:hypothetical protein HYALB_00001578 [Hymenoscyphus albidus]